MLELYNTIAGFLTNNAVPILGILWVASEILGAIPEEYVKANGVLSAIKNIVVALNGVVRKMFGKA